MSYFCTRSFKDIKTGMSYKRNVTAAGTAVASSGDIYIQTLLYACIYVSMVGRPAMKVDGFY
jgi:hypothetical protein